MEEKKQYRLKRFKRSCKSNGATTGTYFIDQIYAMVETETIAQALMLSSSGY